MKRRKEMTNNTENTPIEEQTDRTNKMLLIVLFLFILPNLPKAVLYSVLLYLNEEIISCLTVAREILDVLSMFGFSVTFLVYYNMSQQFRSTLKLLLNKY